MIGITQYTSTLLGSASINDIIATSRTSNLRNHSTVAGKVHEDEIAVEVNNIIQKKK